MRSGAASSPTECRVTAAVREHLEKEFGLDLSRVDLPRLTEMAQRQKTSPTDVPELCGIIAAMIAVHETYFLRHRNHYEWIEKVWFPECAERKTASEEVRVLSAGCSTGEEPYSLVAHLGPLAHAAGLRLTVDAMDINARSLAIAESGRYGLWSMRGVNLEEENSWLTVSSRNIFVHEDIKRAVNFRQHNLMHPLPQTAGYDLILCRNVLIYMHRHAIDVVYSNLAAALRPGGFLLPGPSDPAPSPHVATCRWHAGVRLYQAGRSDEMKGTDVATQTVAHTFPVPEAALVASLPPREPALEPEPARPDCPRNESHEDVEALLQTGQYTAARQILEERLRHDCFDVRSYITLSVLALDLDEGDLARDMIRKAMFIEPDACYAAFISADIKTRYGDGNGALRELRWVRDQLAEMDPENAVRYCEEITAGQLRQVVEIRLAAIGQGNH